MPSVGYCREVCQKYKVKKPVGQPVYANGVKRCKSCAVFMKWEGIYCPCCNAKLKTHPYRNKPIVCRY